MKSLPFSLTRFITLFFISFLSIGFSSCEKEPEKNPSRTPEQILTGNPWKNKEYRGVRGNALVYYQLGGSNNTESFDNEYIVFNANKTGTYVENNGFQRSLVWDFANADQTKVVFTIQLVPYVTTITWENIVYSDAAIKYDQYYTQNGINEHSQAIRIPK